MWPVIVLIAAILGFIAGIAIYAQLDLLQYFSPGAPGPEGLLMLFLGMLVDILVVGVVLSATIKASEQRKWRKLSDQLDRQLADEAWHMLRHASQFRNLANALHEELTNGDIDVETMEARALKLRLIGVLLRGPEAISSAQAIRDSIGMFPISQAQDPDRYVNVALYASRVTGDELNRIQSVLDSLDADLGIYSFDSARDLVDYCRGLFLGFERHLTDLCNALNASGFFDLDLYKRLDADAYDRMPDHQDGLVTWTLETAMWLYTPKEAQDRKGWEMVLQQLVEHEITSLDHVRAEMDTYAPNPSLAITLWRDTPREVKLLPGWSAPSDAPIFAQADPHQRH